MVKCSEMHDQIQLLRIIDLVVVSYVLCFVRAKL